MSSPKRLDQKIAHIREGRSTAADFIIADAKDADIAFGVTAPGPASTACAGGRNVQFCYTESAAACWKPLTDYRDQIREVIRQDNIDLDYYALENFQAFRHEAELKRFRYFLEVFNPNVNPSIPNRTVAAFLNDHIVRTLV